MKRQQGVALITVLLIVAVVTVVMAGLIARQQVSIRSTANQLQVRQAWQYAQGGETLAKALLRRDFLQDDRQAPLDHLGEVWAQPLPPFGLDDGGQLLIRVEDASGRFNLNSLVRGQQADEQAIAQFRRLLLRLQIEEPYAERLRDWLDPDQETSGAYGAEDNQYLLAQPPYRAANRIIGDPSELRLLLGMREDHYRRLRPYVSALPSEVRINVNTAGAMVLSTLADSLTPELAQTLVLARGRQGFRDLQSFLTQPALAGLNLEGQNFSLQSDFFQVVSEVRLGDRRQILVSQLQRGRNGRARVLSRDSGQNGWLPAPKQEPVE
jgi:general secretion pathway protein K